MQANHQFWIHNNIPNIPPPHQYITAKQAVMLVLQKFGMTDKNRLVFMILTFHIAKKLSK